MLRITKAEVGKRALGRAQGVVKLVRGNRVVSHRRRPRKSCLGRRPKPNGSETNDAKPAEVRLFFIGSRPLLPTSSDHGDIKDASNGASGGSRAHPRALKAVQPHLHHARLAAGQPVQRQHDAVLQLALRQRGSCCCTNVMPVELMVAAWLLKLGPRLTTSNLENVILQGRSFTVQNGSEYFTAAAADWTSCRGGPVSGCSLRPTTSSSEI